MYYEGICENKGVIVPEDEAFDYAVGHFNPDKLSELDKKSFAEWFFSGDFIERGGEYEEEAS